MMDQLSWRSEGWEEEGEGEVRESAAEEGE
jgi:hypothetical protein